MRYVRVTVQHHPDAGQQSSSHFNYQEPLGHTDVTTARQFAFRALGDGNFRKGFIKVVFAEGPHRHFRFERMGIAGFSLTEDQREQAERSLELGG